MSREVKSSRRKYHSPLRADQARQTRGRVLEAALGLFVDRGYAGTTVAAIATTNDELVQPYTTTRHDGGADNTTLQAHCWWRIVGHVGLVTDGAVYGLVRSGLRGQSLSTNSFAL